MTTSADSISMTDVNSIPKTETLASTGATIQSRALDSIFKPSRVAVIGATDREGSVGGTVLA
ncbi:MAG: hypothetical protein WCB14_10740, partial [Candidatus Acidiferrales bacterium]